jgi:hypothetical protein
MMLQELQAWINPGGFAYKTNVYSYDASYQSCFPYSTIKAPNWVRCYLGIGITYCQRTILIIKTPSIKDIRKQSRVNTKRQLLTDVPLYPTHIKHPPILHSVYVGSNLK